jgi:outer membrane protein assembly factor BamB
MHAVDLANGRARWVFTTESKVRATPAVSGDVFVGSFDGNFYSVALDGSLRWKQAIGKPIFSSAGCGESIIVCGSHDGALYGFDRSSGAVLWKHVTSGPIVSSPVLIGTTVIGASTDGSVFLLDIATGKCRASHVLPKAVRSSPILVNRTLIVGHECGLTALGVK